MAASTTTGLKERSSSELRSDDVDAEEDAADAIAPQDDAASMLSTVQNRATQLEADLTAKFQRRLHSILNEFLHGIQPSASRTTNGLSIERSDVSVVHTSQKASSGMPHRKVFQLRNSLLTDIMEISHIRTIKAFFVAVFLLFTITSILSESLLQKSLAVDFSFITWAFGKFPLVLLAWSVMHLLVFVLVYAPFSAWIAYRTGGRLRANSLDYLMLAHYICCYGAIIYFPTRLILSYDMPPASALFLSCEQFRMLMKLHSFVREKSVEAFTSETGNTNANFSKFLYFLFAPTLLYRDSYPRTPGPIKWMQVAYNLLGFMVGVVSIGHIIQRTAPTFQALDYKTGSFLSLRSFVQLIFDCSIPCIGIKLITFYGMQHAWPNLTAELLRFGDREFYRDWWNSSSLSGYYRTWNIVIHEFLHQYVYRDLVLVIGRRKWALVAGQLATILFSAVLHEYFIRLVFKCFFPIMFILFAGCGTIFFFIRGSGNKYFASIMIWFSLLTGYGILLCVYSMEWYSRRFCPSIFVDEHEKWKDFYVPRMLTCGWNSNTTSSDAGLIEQCAAKDVGQSEY